MNKITKKSFYSFLTLYLVSSFIFLTLASYWFFNAQMSTEMNSNFHKMNNVVNSVTSDVIYAHMMKEKFILKKFPDATVALYDSNKVLRYGAPLQSFDFSKTYYKRDMTFTLISQLTAGHLDLKYIVVQSSECAYNVEKLRNRIFYTAIIVAILIVIIAVLLSSMFLKPLKDKMQEIDKFIKDTTHELNTPISALMMSTSRVKEKRMYDEKIITNISISTKQLYEIYTSLTFVNFDSTCESAQDILFNDVVANSIKYFNELLDKKKITLHYDYKECPLHMAPTKAKMLINNLLSNAIKYSPPKKNIFISLTENSFSIKDEGIGIAKEKIATIFQRFTRASNYSGGFGVGLNIVKTITDAYGFEVKVDSVLKKGTTVHISFRV
ncbi:HAMP domain-containing histidine kinase [Sulfurimonas sp. SAG-AH-194-I05]|nr:HAMP domain-containing sensor histidine kinase [Sulfurimonas sp. SAG-AH-194-I05]MDF1875134.1 HAMP domain-containing histidine kinase [Sulfurimonas sp. SAG-AH-194-I05]